MIFSGPPAPKFIADAWVVSENVGEGGPGDELRLAEPKARARSERGRVGAMVDERAECAGICNVPHRLAPDFGSSRLF